MQNIELSNKTNQVKEGEYKEYFPNGNVSKISNYKNNKLDGNVKIYYVDGELYKTCNYKDNNLENEYKTYTKLNINTFYTLCGLDFSKLFQDNSILITTHYRSNETRYYKNNIYNNKSILIKKELINNNNKEFHYYNIIKEMMNIEKVLQFLKEYIFIKLKIRDNEEYYFHFNGCILMISNYKYNQMNNYYVKVYDKYYTSDDNLLMKRIYNYVGDEIRL